MIAQCRVDCRNTLGEGAVWDPRSQTLYWTDIEERLLYRLSGEAEVEVISLPERAAFVLPRKRAGFVVGFEARIASCDATFTSFETIVEVESGFTQTRVNDGKVDPFGGIVFGTFDEKDRQPTASVYRLGHDGVLRRLFSQVAISNGIAFSPDATLMYFADTADGTIRRFEIGNDFSRFQEVAPLAGLEVAPGRPDGATVDSEGNYWSARVWGGAVVCISPKGEAVSRIDLPVRGPTCPTLGGPMLTTLYVATLRTRHTEQELEEMPCSGSLFACEVAIPGFPTPLAAF